MSQATQETLLRQLKNPFDPRFVKWRVGATNAEKTKGIALAYIDSREVMKRLDDVCGIGGWRKRLTHFDKGFICELDVLVDNEWLTRSDAAAYTQVEPEKGGASDAFKRAAANWGVGRYLYYLPNVWVEIKPQGKSYVLAEVPELPEWAMPNKNIERWEDVAELEAAKDSGADTQELVDMTIASLDKIRGAKSVTELETILKELPKDDTLLLANEIQAKKRGLAHEQKINADNS